MKNELLPRSLTVRAAVLLAAAVTGTSLPAGDVFVTVDFLDQMGMTRYQPVMTVEKIQDMVRRYKETGVAGFLWRVASLGVAGYRTPTLTQVEEVDDVDITELKKRAVGSVNLLRRPLWRESYTKTWSRTLNTVDVYTEVEKTLHAEGMKLYFWIDLFDEMRGKFLAAHPECLVRTPEGGTFPGLRDYANEMAVREKLDEIAELYRYRPDGLYLSSSCHARHLKFTEADEAFGRLPAAKFTEFLRRLRAESAPHGIKLMISAPFGGSLNFCSPYFSNHVKYRIEVDWKTWIDEGLADSLSLAEYNILWGQTGIWASKGLTDAGPGHYGLDVFAPEYVAYNRGRVKLYVFNGLDLKSRPEAISRATCESLKFGLDGQIVHESMLLENQTEDMNALKEACRRLKEQVLPGICVKTSMAKETEGE